jgi:prepilin-type N-terminal cleavage/methylation domain-containing protein
MKKTIKGFTLIEMLLVLVIISMILYASIGYMQQRTEAMRIDRATTQMQQILNAGLAFYVANGKWPASLDNDLRTGYYLPPTTVPLVNPWGGIYTIGSPTQTAGSPPNFYVWTTITTTTASGTAGAAASVIAGGLPLAYATSNSGSPPPPGGACGNAVSCNVAAAVNIPGQNLNNARAVNFTGVYHHGACVPVPQCPVDSSGQTMTPQIMVVPVSVSGVNDQGNTNAYPITSFSGYDTGNTPLDANPPACLNSSPPGPPCPSSTNGTSYWRVCMKVITEKGDVQTTRSDLWGVDVTLLAITRCAVNNEPSGSDFSIYSN